MKIMRLSNTCGSPCSSLDLWAVLNGSLPEEYLDHYVISLRDELWVTTLPRGEGDLRDSYFKLFTLGEAKAIVSEALDNGGRRKAQVSIESPNQADFVLLYKSVYEDWLRIPHEHIAVPSYRLQEPSFVRGIRNDLRALREFLRSRLLRMPCHIGLHAWEKRSVNAQDRYPSIQRHCPNCGCLKTRSELSRYKWQLITPPFAK